MSNTDNTSTDNTSTDNKEDILGFMKDHIKRYLATNGEDGHLMNGFPCLVLTTTGKKSGEKRQAAVIYGQQGNNYVVVASKGGSDAPPAWFVNMEASKRAHIQVKDKKLDVKMRIAEGAERQQLWDMMAKIFPDYNNYQKSTQRQIAVCVLEPV
jgi:deazaflavin-dependent oxidoreductase (nitroreductase family)